MLTSTDHRRVLAAGAHRRVQLMATCLCDAFYGDVARASVEVLEHLGCEVEFPEAQTCCGQPALNSGDWPASRKVVRHTLRAFAGNCPVVTPSASCAGMLLHGALLAFEDEPDLLQVQHLGGRTWELADFIVNGLGIHSWSGRYDATVAFHRSCHSRGTDSGEAALRLLGSISGLTLASIREPEQCCGFGGLFSVGFPLISTQMGAAKLACIRSAAPHVLASADVGCLMHLQGLAEREAKPFKAQHLAQILRDALATSERQ